MVAHSVGCPTPRLKLIRAAHALRDEDGAAGLTEGASLLAVVVPLPPSEDAQAQADPQPGDERVRATLEVGVVEWACERPQCSKYPLPGAPACLRYYSRNSCRHQKSCMQRRQPVVERKGCACNSSGRAYGGARLQGVLAMPEPQER